MQRAPSGNIRPLELFCEVRKAVSEILDKPFAAALYARENGEEAASLAAHGAGQAVGTAHVNTHALGCSIYAITTAAAHSGNADDGLINERNWQLQRLRLLASKKGASCQATPSTNLNASFIPGR